MIQKKVCLLGSSGVGKTSLIKQYVEGIFSEKYLTSIGVKIDKKLLQVDDADIQLMLWDIEGIDRYCGFQPKYLRGAAAYIIVCDQIRSQSLTEGLEIQQMIKEIADIPGIIAINKSDLQDSWHWGEGELNKYQRLFDATFHTSAKTGENVNAMFHGLAKLIL